MVRRTVKVERQCDASADAAWSILRDFCGAWHPAVATIAAERGPDGGLVRRFTVHGEATTYREELTYISDSDRTLHYRQVEGIRDVTDYGACVAVSSADENHCLIAWSAEIEAAEPRASEVANGTKLIFESGIAALQRMLPRTAVLAGQPNIALTVAGKPGPTLCLFLHGIGGNRKNWLPQLAAAAPTLHSAALDLRGYGESGLGHSPSTVDDYCGDILKVMGHFGAERVVLCGLSYGAWIATSFAMRHPEKLAGLVLAGGCTGMSEAGFEERERFRLSREAPLDQGKAPADFAADVVGLIASPEAPELVRRQLIESMAAIPAETYRDAVRCFTRPAEQFDFSRISCPVLFVTGEFDKLASPAEIRAVAKRVEDGSRSPNVRFEVLARAGHVCNVEKPDAFNAVLVDFLLGLAA